MLYKNCFLMLFLVLLFACTATPTPVPTPVIPIPTSVPLAPDVLAIYHKSGGIVGIDETLTVSQGGQVELTTRNGINKSIRADEPMLQPIRRMLEQNEFIQLAAY